MKIEISDIGWLTIGVVAMMFVVLVGEVMWCHAHDYPCPECYLTSEPGYNVTSRGWVYNCPNVEDEVR